MLSLMSGIVLSTAAQWVRAEVFLLSSPDEWSGNETIIDFEGFPGETIITDQYEAEGVSFSLSNGQAPRTGFTENPRNFGPPGEEVINNFPEGAPVPFPDLIITFASPMNRMAFEIRNHDGDDLILSLMCANNRTLVSEHFLVTDTNFRWIGMESDVPFDQLVLSATDLQEGGLIIDNLRFEFDADLAPPGDLNRDGSINLVDHTSFSDCLTGPGGGVLDGCELADFDADDDVDMRDAAAFIDQF